MMKFGTTRARLAARPRFGISDVEFYISAQPGLIPLETSPDVSSGLPFRFGRNGSLTGFTMVELVVMLGMLTFVASIVLASFPRLSQRIHLQRSGQQAALTLRRAQNMAFAVRQVETPSGRIIPPAYGLYFDRATPGSYLLFADLESESGTHDGMYRSGEDVIVETISLDPGVVIGQIVSDLGGANQPQQVLNISFTVPEARMAITNAALAVGESAQIELLGASGAIRTIVVRTSGQIRVQ
ncbi:MAG: type II secretion system protein [bacterium]|nr:type II secretion system protein [bacterium]